MWWWGGGCAVAVALLVLLILRCRQPHKTLQDEPHNTPPVQVKIIREIVTSSCSMERERLTSTGRGSPPSSPKYSTPPESAASSRSVYVDAVPSPRFFPDNLSPLPFSTIAANTPESPRTPNAAKQSPKVNVRDKENYFTFENVQPAVAHPRHYVGRSSIEKERVTPPSEKESVKYRRHNSCDSCNLGGNNTGSSSQHKRLHVEKDVVDCCSKMDNITISASENTKNTYTLEPQNLIQTRRQRPKSISLDSENAKMLEQKLFEEAFLMKESGTCVSKQQPRRCRNPRNLTIDLGGATSELVEESPTAPRTPTLRHKAISLDSSDAATFSLPKQDLLQVPNNSVSVPNTPKRQLKRLITPRAKDASESRRHCIKDSGVFLRDNHASLMLYQPARSWHLDEDHLSVSTANLKTLPEAEPTDEFQLTVQEPLTNLDRDYTVTTVRNSLSNYSLGETESLSGAEHIPAETCSDSGRLSANSSCLLQRRGSNNSLTLNLPTTPLTQFSSNCSLNRDLKPPKKGLLERRSSNTSLTLNINSCQWSNNRGLSVSNYNLNRSSCNLSRYNSNQSLEQSHEQKKGILERRSSNTSLTLTLPNLLPRTEAEKQRKCMSNDDLAASSSGSVSDVCNDATLSSSSRAWSVDEGVISTAPLSPRSTATQFRAYLATMHHLQSASSVLTRQRLRDLYQVFTHGFSTYECSTSLEEHNSKCTSAADDRGPCANYQKWLLRTMHQEFWDMPTNFQEKPLVTGSNLKNRYKTILPNEHSRFLLKTDQGLASDILYINANYIKGHDYGKNMYIATQGPLQNTIYDFWLMVRQNVAAYDAPGLQKIVMLTNLVEKNQQKCEQYFPAEPGTFQTVRCPEDRDSFTIHTRELIQKTGFTVRKLDITHTKGREFKAIHYWFHNWADHKCPSDVDALLQLAIEVLDKDGLEAPPSVVHCSAGVGRTGCLIAIMNGIRQLSSEKKVDVLGIVCNMRLDRGGMVQSSEQYELIHQVLAAYERKCLSRTED